jgi:hypothetical protein
MAERTAEQTASELAAAEQTASRLAGQAAGGPGESVAHGGGPGESAALGGAARAPAWAGGPPWAPVDSERAAMTAQDFRDGAGRVRAMFARAEAARLAAGGEPAADLAPAALLAVIGGRLPDRLQLLSARELGYLEFFENPEPTMRGPTSWLCAAMNPAFGAVDPGLGFRLLVAVEDRAGTAEDRAGAAGDAGPFPVLVASEVVRWPADGEPGAEPGPPGAEPGGSLLGSGGKRAGPAAGGKPGGWHEKWPEKWPERGPAIRDGGLIMLGPA